MSSVDLSLILSSQARFRVLQTLTLLSIGLGLREIERQTHLNIRSVQIATQSLVKEKILKKNANGLFLLNASSPAAKPLQGLFKYLRDVEISKKSKAFSERAQWTLQLSQEVSNLIRQARRPSGTRSKTEAGCCRN